MPDASPEFRDEELREMLETFAIDAVVLAAAWAWSRVLRRPSSNASISLRDAEVEDDEETQPSAGAATSDSKMN